MSKNFNVLSCVYGFREENMSFSTTNFIKSALAQVFVYVG